MVNYFKDLYATEYPINGYPPSQGMFPLIPTDDMECLMLSISDDEIRRAVFSMAPLKVPGIDKFHAKFYRENWDNVGSSICSMVRQIMGGASVDPMINRTLIVLLPKVQVP